ncbi:hypothetical protein D3C79_639070 [compost metagenome]
MDEFARVHLVQRIPDRLEIGKGIHDLGGVHDPQVFPLGLAITMLARQRTAVAHDQVSRLLQECSPVIQAVLGFQVEGNARVDTAITKVPVEVGLVAVAADQALELAKVLAKVLGLDRCILPPYDRIRRVRVQPQRGRRGARLSDRPDSIHQTCIGHQPHTWAARQLRRDVHGLLGEGNRLLSRQSTELDHQPGVASRKLSDIGKLHAAFFEPIDDAIIQPFHCDWVERQQLRYGVGCVIDLVIAQHHQHAVSRVLHQNRLSLQDGDAGAFYTHQRACNVEAVFRQQLIEVVARHATFELGEPLANVCLVAIDQRFQCLHDLGTPPTGLDVFLVGGLVGRPDPETLTVIGQNFQALDVFDCLAGHHRVSATGVVADHAAQRAAAMGCRVRAEGQPHLGRLAFELIADHTRLHPGQAPCRVDLMNSVKVFGGIDHNRRVHRLAAHGGTRATRQYRHAGLFAEAYRGHDIVDGFGNDNAYRQLTIV